jgi:hypothetical protein
MTMDLLMILKCKKVWKRYSKPATTAYFFAAYRPREEIWILSGDDELLFIMDAICDWMNIDVTPQKLNDITERYKS